jgi:hypothetical protein
MNSGTGYDAQNAILHFCYSRTNVYCGSLLYNALTMPIRDTGSNVRYNDNIIGSLILSILCGHFLFPGGQKFVSKVTFPFLTAARTFTEVAFPFPIPAGMFPKVTFLFPTAAGTFTEVAFPFPIPVGMFPEAFFMFPMVNGRFSIAVEALTADARRIHPIY